MQVEITEEIKNAVVKQIADKLLGEIRTQVNVKNLVTTCLNEVRSEVVSKVAGEIHKKLNTENLVESTFKAAEDRIQHRIQKILQQGVTINLKGLDK